MVPGMTEVMRTYGQDGSVGCSSSDTSDPSAWEDRTRHRVAAVGCRASDAYSDLMDRYAAASCENNKK